MEEIKMRKKRESYMKKMNNTHRYTTKHAKQVKVLKSLKKSKSKTNVLIIVRKNV